MTPLRKCAIVDIDGTLANIDHRLHHLGKGPNVRDVTDKAEARDVDWDAFHADCHLDEAIEPTCSVVRSLGEDADWCIILITGRACAYREATEKWLQENDIPYDLLLMRETGNHELDVDLKRRWLQMIRSGQLSIPGTEQPSIVFEDRARTIQMWREEGLVALQCDEGEF